MKKRPLGTTGIILNEIGFGAMHLSIDKPIRPAETDSIDLIRRAVDDLGIDFIDTADAYCNDDTETGHNERLIAEALRGERRGRVIVATKGGCTRPDGRWERNGTPKHLRAACEASLKALETETIQLYQHHAPDPDVPVEESIGALADLQREGKILHIGISNYTVEQLQRGMHEATIVSVQDQYSVINRRSREEEMIEFCEKNHLTYIPWNPVGGRSKAKVLGEEYELLEAIARKYGTSAHTIALAWQLQRSPVMIPIPGTRKFQHLEDDVRAAEITLTAEEIEELNSM